jgi:Zn-dependent metalloprotease
MEAFIAAGSLKSLPDEDHGGVHIFSGIPNRAFVICAEAFGGHSWEKAGQIWWRTVTTHRLAPACTFIQFADATVTVAQEMYDDKTAQVVRKAWDTVGVVKSV